MYRRILLALDREGLAERALPVVIALARRSLAEVVVVSVRDAETGLGPAGATAEATSAVVARLESEGVRACAEVMSTHARSVASVIVEAARRLHADLVALGSRGRGDLAGLLLGSVGHRAAAGLDCQVLLVRGGDSDTGSPPLTTLLFAIDDSGEAAGALETAGRLAREHEAAVVVVHALEQNAVDRHGYAAAFDEGRALLDGAAEQLGGSGLTVDTELLLFPGPVAPRLAAAADDWDADLVVLGSRRPSELGGLLLGSVAHDLVRRTPRPVLLAERPRAGAVRPPDTGPPGRGQRPSPGPVCSSWNRAGGS